MRNQPIIIRAFAAAVLLPAVAIGMAADPAPRAPRSDWTTTQTLWDSGTYDYDDAGNVIAIGTDVYRYDKAGRLKFATAGTAPPPSGQLPANRQEFDYDRYGNLLSLEVTTAQETKRHGFAVDAATNQLGLQCSGPVDGCFTGFYDAATGNQLGRLGAGEYVWDALGVLAELRTSRNERYVYDADGERILVIDNTTGSERYTLRNAANKVTRELSRTPATSTWKLDKDYVHRGATLIASFSGAQTAPDRHYHLDHLGSTRLVTDDSGHRRAIHTYWPFGPEAAGSETDGERLKFTGHERDSSPGTTPGFDLDYMHARYYDANAARFLSVDPGQDWDRAQPQSWNMYAYVRNNPANATDPDGRQAVLELAPFVPHVIASFATVYFLSRYSLAARANMRSRPTPVLVPPAILAQRPHIVTPSGVILPGGTDVNLVPTATGTAGDFLQIHDAHPHDDAQPHTHRPEVHESPDGQIDVNRVDAPTTAEDIDEADRRVRDRELRPRKNRKDKGDKEAEPKREPKKEKIEKVEHH